MEISNEILEARRLLEAIDNYELLEDLVWYPSLNRWVFKFRITGEFEPTNHVPVVTEWYCMVSPLYPHGKISIYPAKENAISCTFQHQSYNRANSDQPWRTGNICVSTSVGLWGKSLYNKEPFQPKERLSWNIRRCKSWVAAAAANVLTQNGDPFELPDLPSKFESLIAFNEDEESFTSWGIHSKHVGVAYFKKIFPEKSIYAITRFKINYKEIQYGWGKHISESKNPEIASICLILEAIPVKEPWQLPSTWKELFIVCEKQGIDLKKILLNKLHVSNHILIGFPIPENIGEANSRIHWMAIKLPKIPKLNGFRDSSPQLPIAQFAMMFKNDSHIDWIMTENWNKMEITSRGKINPDISNLRITIIGAGAIGSYFSEILLRLGCYNITIIDGDNVEVGNMSRHTLTMNDVGVNKAEAVSKRLNALFPNANVIPIKHQLNGSLNPKILQEVLDGTDIFVDATAEDTLIKFASIWLNGMDKKFISLSTGFAANRLFCFMTNTKDGDLLQEFTEMLSPWLKKDASENPDPEFQREGIGCWHPVFPARIDDILMLLSMSVNRVEDFLKNGEDLKLVVVEKDKDKDGNLLGVKIVDE